MAPTSHRGDFMHSWRANASVLDMKSVSGVPMSHLSRSLSSATGSSILSRSRAHRLAGSRARRLAGSRARGLAGSATTPTLRRSDAPTLWRIFFLFPSRRRTAFFFSNAVVYLQRPRWISPNWRGYRPHKERVRKNFFLWPRTIRSPLFCMCTSRCVVVVCPSDHSS